MYVRALRAADVGRRKPSPSARVGTGYGSVWNGGRGWDSAFGPWSPLTAAGGVGTSTNQTTPGGALGRGPPPPRRSVRRHRGDDQKGFGGAIGGGLAGRGGIRFTAAAGKTLFGGQRRPGVEHPHHRIGGTSGVVARVATGRIARARPRLPATRPVGVAGINHSTIANGRV